MDHTNTQFDTELDSLRSMATTMGLLTLFYLIYKILAKNNSILSSIAKLLL